MPAAAGGRREQRFGRIKVRRLDWSKINSKEPTQVAARYQRHPTIDDGGLFRPTGERAAAARPRRIPFVTCGWLAGGYGGGQCLGWSADAREVPEERLVKHMWFKFLRQAREATDGWRFERTKRLFEGEHWAAVGAEAALEGLQPDSSSSSSSSGSSP